MIVKDIRQNLRLATISIVASFVFSVFALGICLYFYNSYVQNISEKIYVLDKNYTPLKAHQSLLNENRGAEYKAHVDLFHSLYFNLAPDNDFIESQTKKAMYLVDENGLKYYNHLKEKGFFNQIMSTSATISLIRDSIDLNLAQGRFKFYGKQIINRRSTKTIRKIITEGSLKDMPRTDNNPHGVLIENWMILDNSDIEVKQKRTL